MGRYCVKSVSPSSWCSQIPTENGISRSRDGEKEKDSRTSSKDEPMSCLQHVTIQLVSYTGGKGSITQWVHAEYMEGSETICLTFTQWVRGRYFSKVPTKVPTR